MRQFQIPGTVWEDEHGREYKNVVVLPHEQKIKKDGSLFLQAAFYYSANNLDKPPFFIYTISFPKDAEIEELVLLKDIEGNLILDEFDKPQMDIEKTTFVHIGAPRICQNLKFNWPVEDPLPFTPLNRASQEFWNSLEFMAGLKFGDYFEFEGGFLPE